MSITGFDLDVHITADDLAHGKRGNCSECPGALAIIRALSETPFTLRYSEGYHRPYDDKYVPPKPFVSVTLGSVDITTTNHPGEESDQWWQAHTPDELESFIEHFDNSDVPDPDPVRFTLSFMREVEI